MGGCCCCFWQLCWGRRTASGSPSQNKKAEVFTSYPWWDWRKDGVQSAAAAQQQVVRGVWCASSSPPSLWKGEESLGFEGKRPELRWWREPGGRQGWLLTCRRKTVQIQRFRFISGSLGALVESFLVTLCNLTTVTLSNAVITAWTLWMFQEVRKTRHCWCLQKKGCVWRNQTGSWKKVTSNESNPC